MGRGRIAEERSDDIMNAARSLLVEKGTGMTIEAIAKRAGVGKGTIFLYWSSKAQLLDAVFYLDLAELLKKVSVLTDAEPLAYRLSFLMSKVLQVQLTHPILKALFRSETVTEKLDNSILSQVLRKMIPIARSYGVLKSMPDEEIALGIEAMVFGVLHISMDDRMYTKNMDLPQMLEQMIQATYEKEEVDVTTHDQLASAFRVELENLIYKLVLLATPERKKEGQVHATELINASGDKRDTCLS